MAVMTCYKIYFLFGEFSQTLINYFERKCQRLTNVSDEKQFFSAIASLTCNKSKYLYFMFDRIRS